MSKSDSFLAHLCSLSPDDRKREIHDRIRQEEHQLENAEEVSSEIAMTNASGFTVDDVDVDDIDISETEARVSFTFSMSGDQDEDRPWSGTTIRGNGVAVIDDDGSVSFADIFAERNLEEGEDDIDDLLI